MKSKSLLIAYMEGGKRPISSYIHAEKEFEFTVRV
jgi:hypothetical protein